MREHPRMQSKKDPSSTTADTAARLDDRRTGNRDTRPFPLRAGSRRRHPEQERPIRSGRPVSTCGLIVAQAPMCTLSVSCEKRFSCGVLRSCRSSADFGPIRYAA